MGKRDNRVVSNRRSPAGTRPAQRTSLGSSAAAAAAPSAGLGGEAVGSWALPQPGQPHRCGGLGGPGRPAAVLRPPEGVEGGRRPTARGKRALGPAPRRAGGTRGLAGYAASGLGGRPADLGAPCRQATKAGRALRTRPAGVGAPGSGAWAAGGAVWGVPQRGQARARGSQAEPLTALSNPAAVVRSAQ